MEVFSNMPVKIVKSPTIYKSVSLNGSTDYLTVPDNAALRFGAADFTIEGWVYPTANGQGNGSVIICQSANGVSSQYSVYYNSTNNLSFYNEDTFYNSRNTTGGQLTLNAWNYIVVSRKAGSVYVGVSGSFVSDLNVNATYRTVPHAISIGSQLGYTGTFFTGYISNLRVVNGTCLYSSSFTPPTAPLLPITNTSLLTCASTTFKDISSNNFTVSSFGSPTVSDVVPYNVPRNGFKLSSSNTRSEFKKSVQFNGSSQYLTATKTGGWLNSANNFTLECWVYFTRNPSTYGGYYGSHIAGTTAGSSGWELGFSSDGVSTTSLSINFKDRGGVGVTRTFNTNTWYHVAIVRSGTTVSMYIDGTLGSYGTIASWPDNNTLHIGALNYSPYFYYFPGYISNFRIVDGTAVYTSNFTPSTTALTAITNTSLLICQDSVTKDNSSNNFTVNAVASPTLSALNPFTVNQIYSKMGRGGNITYGQIEYTTPGTYTFTAPAGVTSVSVVCVGGGGGGGSTGGVGGGGGGGGGLGWKNNISVISENSYTVVVGIGGSSDSTTHGGDSYFINTSTVAGLGGRSSTDASGGDGGGYVGDGGGNGGTPSYSGTGDSTGGGGAGGYSGNGGGSVINTDGTAGSGGGGGGGGAGGSSDAASGGGGVGLLGEGSSGGGGDYTGANAGAGGGGGSGGAAGGFGTASPNNSGGAYGGGGGGAELNGEAGNGASGAVRIIWGGLVGYPNQRAFPSTNTGNL